MLAKATVARVPSPRLPWRLYLLLLLLTASGCRSATPEPPPDAVTYDLLEQHMTVIAAQILNKAPCGEDSNRWIITYRAIDFFNVDSSRPAPRRPALQMTIEYRDDAWHFYAPGALCNP